MTTPLPSGTVAFLFTDIEGSTQLFQSYPDQMIGLLKRHHAILSDSIAEHHGQVFQIIGDAFCAAFTTTGDALLAALGAQRRLQQERWEPAPIKVRMGIHTGPAQHNGALYGLEDHASYLTLTLTQRVMSTAYGGQVLLSNAAAALLQSRLPPGAGLRDMGEHRLKGLANPEHIWQLEAPGLVLNFPALKSLTTLPNNLPLQLTRFIGREKELVEVRNLLRSARLVTLTGSGGTGKTRLALEIGAEELSSFSGGVWLVELAALVDPAQIIPELAQVLGLQEIPPRPLSATVLDYLRDKELLLLLDNCEHLIGACAGLANDLLRQCPRLKILASSREGLGIAGEIAYRIPSLAEEEAARLFVERAGGVQPNFQVTGSSRPAIVKICQRLDGIPLAIELAAARTRLLTPEQIVARLDDRFRLLVGGSRTALPRQQTLRALIDWSYSLLTEDEKRLLETTSLFVGGWTLEAIESVVDDADKPEVWEHLDSLMNKSMVIAQESSGEAPVGETSGSEMRYTLLETIRQYARERLLDSGLVAEGRERHFAYFDALSEVFWEKVRTPEMPAWFAKMEVETDNFRAAFEWGLDHHPEEALHLAANIVMVKYMATGLTEANHWVRAALERVDRLPPVEGQASLRRLRGQGRAMGCLATEAMLAGDYLKSAHLAEKAVENARQTGDRIVLGNNLTLYGLTGHFLRLPGWQAAGEEGLAVALAANDLVGIPSAYLVMWLAATDRGDLSGRQKYIDEAWRILKDLGSPVMTAIFFLGVGRSETMLGRYESARQAFEKGLALFERAGNRYFAVTMMSEMAHISRHMGDLNRARALYRQTIARWQELGVEPAVAHELECFAFLAIAEGQYPRASQLFGAAEAMRGRSSSQMTEQEQVEYNQAVARLRSVLPEEEGNALWSAGRSMTMAQAVVFAVES